MIKESKNSRITIFIYSRKFFCLHLKYYFKKYNPKLVSGLKHYYDFIFLKTF